MWLVANFLVLHDGKNIIGAGKKEVELVMRNIMEMFIVKIQDSKKQYKEVIFYEKYF